MRRAPSLSSIEAFLAAADCGSLREAADQLCLSASAVTRRIQALERHSGAALFDRSGGKIALTAAGRDAAARLRSAMQGVRDALNAQEDPTAPVRLRISRSLAGLWLAPRLARLPKQIALEFHSDLALEDVLANAADLGVFFGGAALGGLVAQELLPIQLSVVCAPRLADGRAPPPRDADLSAYSLLDLPPHIGLWRRLDPAARGSLSFDGVQAMYEAAAAGLGLAHGLHPLVEPYLASGRLVELPWIERAAGGAYYLVATRGGLRSEKVARVFDWLLAEAALAAPVSAN